VRALDLVHGAKRDARSSCKFLLREFEGDAPRANVARDRVGESHPLEWLSASAVEIDHRSSSAPDVATSTASHTPKTSRG